DRAHRAPRATRRPLRAARRMDAPTGRGLTGVFPFVRGARALLLTLRERRTAGPAGPAEPTPEEVLAVPQSELPAASVLSEDEELRQALVVAEERAAGATAAVPDEWRDSARNLVHYLALRRLDVRDLQDRLAAFGLSSLGRAEAQVLPTVDLV